MSSEPTTVQSDLSELIAENFGANATYVETLLARFRSDPSLVDESWRTYFEELLGNGHPGASAGAVASSAQPEPAKPRARRSLKNRREHGGESLSPNSNLAATHSGEAARREPSHHQHASSGQRSRQG